ncbi:MAG TPA: F0F1 ATP synthase subunit B [Pseudonocardiaceae bacterium]|jgi:ATP synthase F0 subunit b|nr:F0F1 ATP synthase subunit B [Pseudonocardiaceae bacterium]
MYAYITEGVGFLLVVYVIWRKVVPPLGKAMRRQQDAIRKQVEDAKLASERLAEAERKYQDAIAEARTEAAKIRDAARVDADRIVVEMREQAEREVARIRQRGEEDLVSQRQQVARELRARIGELSVDLAGKLVTERLASDQQRSAAVDRLLDQLEAMAPAAGKGDA